jgi:acyl transferase domain-containing protein
VRFAAGLRELLSDPERMLVEVGPGRTLSGFANRSAGGGSRTIALSSLRHPSETQSDVAFALAALGKLWQAGVEVDWRAFHGVARRRVSLPTYPFERQRYWVERTTSASPAARKDHGNKRPDVSHWFYAPSWKRSPAPRVESGPGRQGPWLLFSDASGLGEQLERRLRNAGHEVASVLAGAAFEGAAGRYALNPAEPRDYARLLVTLQAEGRAPATIVHLWGLDDTRRAQELGFLSLVYLARALGNDDAAHREIVVVSRGVQDVTGEEQLQPEWATLLGPCKVIPQEYPRLACRSVDLAAAASRSWDDAAVSQVLEELLSDSEDRAVAYRGGRRWVQDYEPWRLPAVAGGPLRLRDRGVYLITGGLGGIGLEVAESLAREVRARLVLVGRSGLPPRAEWERLTAQDAQDEMARRLRRLRALEELGAEVLVLQADAAELEPMRSVVREAEARFGALNGVVQAVGVDRAFQSIPETGPCEAQAQFRPRLGAAAVLEQVLEWRSLDFCLLFSSLAAVLGARGSVAYTAAHASLDAFVARHNRASSVPWQSVDWDRWNTWRDGDAVPAEGEAGLFMTSAEALEALRRTLSARPLTQLVVSTGDLQARIDRWIRRHAPRERVEAGAAHGSLYARPELGQEYVAPRTEAERTLAAIWSEALGVERVGVHDDFFELGGDSVLGLRIVAKANEAGLRMVGRQIFEHQTIAALAAALAGAPPQGPQPATAPQRVETGSAFPAARLNEQDLKAVLNELGRGTEAE